MNIIHLPDDMAHLYEVDFTCDGVTSHDSDILFYRRYRSCTQLINSFWVNNFSGSEAKAHFHGNI